MRLLVGILIALILLSVCITIDSATQTDTITNVKQSSFDKAKLSNINSDYIITNGTYVDTTKGCSTIVPNPSKDKVYSVYPEITMTGRPSCSRCSRNHCAYTWRTKTYVNYCPNCHHYGCLGNKHKWAARHEQEITCLRCDSDYCINCGKEKYSWSSVYLRK